MIRIVLFGIVFLGFLGPSHGQDKDGFKVRKGVVIDSLPVRDTVVENFAMYLPTSFENNGKWPVLFVFDMKGRAKQALAMFKKAAEEQNYILAASNNVSDTLPISDNVLIANRMFNTVYDLLPIHKDRVYTAGIESGAKMASLIPVFVKSVEGVVAIGAPFPNTELLSEKDKFHFIGIVGREDFNYSEMVNVQKVFNRLKYPNSLLIHDGGDGWPPKRFIDKAFYQLTFASMARGDLSKDTVVLERQFKLDLEEVRQQIASRRLLEAYEDMGTVLNTYKAHFNTDSLRQARKDLKKDRVYRAQKREMNNIQFKESLLKDDYRYSLLEDLDALNYNNLGWWNFQMGELRKYDQKPRFREKQLGKRLIGFLNALVEDNIDIERSQKIVDMQAVSFLWMLKTITDPKDYSYYLKIISDSSKFEDYGTALFYLEELLKNGYQNKAELYDLEHTALLRITPEFNKLVKKYLDQARYNIIEQ